MEKLVITGMVDGIDFTKKGSMIRDGQTISYNSAIKYTITFDVAVVKEGITLTQKRKITIKVPQPDEMSLDQLIHKVQSEQSKVGTKQSFEVVPPEGFTIQGRLLDKVVK